MFFNVDVFQPNQQVVNLTRTVYQRKPSASGESAIVQTRMIMEMGKLSVSVSKKHSSIPLLSSKRIADRFFSTFFKTIKLQINLRRNPIRN